MNIRRCTTLIIFLALSLSLADISSAADVQFSAAVDRNALGLNETFTLTLEIQGAGLSSADPKLPDLSDFRLISGPNQSTSFQFINGRASSSRTYSFILKPEKTGSLTIGSAELTLSGKLYRTDPITVTVSGNPSSTGGGGTSGQGGQAAPPAGQAQPQAQSTPPAQRVRGNPSDLFVQVSADRTQAYQGEQIILTYTLYTRLSVNTYEVTKLPGMAGFWAEEFPAPPQGPEVRDVVVNGMRYRAATIRKVALFPTRSGDLTIDPLEVTCQVQVLDRARRSSNDPFDMLFDSPFMRYRNEERFVTTEPLRLKILPLPEAGKPANFSGAVGDFNLDVSLDPQQAKTNEALTMTLRFSGSGNIKMLPKPDFKAPADFESYDPKESVQVDKNGPRISGTKTYEYVLIPRFAGMQKIPPVSFSFFNPASKSYQTLTKGGYDLQVGQGSNLPAASAPGISKEDVKLLGQDIHYLKPPGRLLPMAQAGGLPGIYSVGMILPPLIVLLYLAAIRIMGDSAFQARMRSRKAFIRAQSDLKKLEKAAAGSKGDHLVEFYGSLHRSLLAYLGEKLKLPARGLKEDEVLEHLAGHKAGAEQVDEIREIFHTCNWARFAPESGQAEQMGQILQRTRVLVNKLEESWERTA